MIIKFLKATRSYEEVVISVVEIAVANVLVQRYPEYNLNHIQFCNRCWNTSLFTRMNFVRRAGTTGKIEITEGVRKEAELTFLHQIIQHLESFTNSTISYTNLDQTNYKLFSVSKTTMTKKGSNSVPIAG